MGLNKQSLRFPQGLDFLIACQEQIDPFNLFFCHIGGRVWKEKAFFIQSMKILVPT